MAEGIETEAERAVLAKLEIPLRQGDLFGRPAVASTWAVPHALPPARGRAALRAIPGWREPRI